MSSGEVFCEPTFACQYSGHKSTITQIRFNPECNRVATSSEDSSVTLWNLIQPDTCIRFGSHKDKVLSVSWSASSNLVASASKDRKVMIWEPKTGGGSAEFIAHEKSVRSVDFNLTGTELVTSSYKSLKLWNVSQPKCVTFFNGHTNWVRSAKFSPNGKLIASCGDDKMLRIFDTLSGNTVREFKDTFGMGSQIAWHPSGAGIALAMTSHCVKIFDVSEGLVKAYRIHKSPVNDLAFHPNGYILVTAGDDKVVKVLDLLKGRSVYTLRGHTDSVRAVAISQDGSVFASGGADRQLVIWKTDWENADDTDGEMVAVNLTVNNVSAGLAQNSKDNLPDKSN